MALKEQIIKRSEYVKALREAGKTYNEIGEELGVSRQRAHQLVRYVPGDGVHVRALLEIPYTGLREWMLENRVSLSELERRCGIAVKRAAKGDGCNKAAIDAILRVTGLDYETCFKVSDAEAG